MNVIIELFQGLLAPTTLNFFVVKRAKFKMSIKAFNLYGITILYEL